MIESLASLPKLKATIRLSKVICVMCGAQHIELFCYSHLNFRGKHGTLYALPRLPENSCATNTCWNGIIIIISMIIVRVYYVVTPPSSCIGHWVVPPSFDVFSNESKTLKNVHLCSASHCKHRILDTRYTIDEETLANWLAFANETTWRTPYPKRLRNARIFWQCSDVKCHLPRRWPNYFSTLHQRHYEAAASTDSNRMSILMVKLSAYRAPYRF